MAFCPSKRKKARLGLMRPSRSQADSFPDALHATRLLPVEERPFLRVQKSLLSPNSLLRVKPARQLPSPPPEGQEGGEGRDDKSAEPPNKEEDDLKLRQFREEVLMDFANLESSILRIQLIQSSNQRERERYAAEKAKILETAQAVRDNTVELRAQLEEAQKVLERRKGYDELAGKILDDKKLRSRDDCRAEIERLEKEIEDLQQESADYETTWSGRKEQFGKIVAEGEAMRRLIKGIKDEPEGEKEDEDMEGEDGTRGESSRMGTPAPGATPMHGEGDTPLPASQDAGASTQEKPDNQSFETNDATRTSSRAGSPPKHTAEASVDVEMLEQEGPPKDSKGMEATAQQVAEPAEGMTEQMDES
ncbi:hypothetical protein KC340_g15702 [Hortaea werneckii]|nr:hypothetical protein KC342_g16015 [Hortaea werneckii]KAI7061991.1 hypothetical protein KC339_g16665 [Hortaea werneckii]KAI7214420.1 hypothetical protein KC365_g13946 [Hortaea werneckii]KAI7295665.1 hypothetical protein KC340_g15702 [Hortaea werneckii]KAI7371929.1 hypothetical protein KC328_g17438 [Hortaea werneckii]